MNAIQKGFKLRKTKNKTKTSETKSLTESVDETEDEQDPLMQRERNLVENFENVDEKKWNSKNLLDGFKKEILRLDLLRSMGEVKARKYVIQKAREMLHLNQLRTLPENIQYSDFLQEMSAGMKTALGKFYEYYRKGFIVLKNKPSKHNENQMLFLDVQGQKHTNSIKLYDLLSDFVRNNSNYMTAKEINQDFSDLSVLCLFARDVENVFPTASPFEVNITNESKPALSKVETYKHKFQKVEGSTPLVPIVSKYFESVQEEVLDVMKRVTAYNNSLNRAKVDFRKTLFEWTYPIFPAPKKRSDDPNVNKALNFEDVDALVQNIRTNFPSYKAMTWTAVANRIRRALPSKPSADERDKFLKDWDQVERKLATLPSTLDYAFYYKTTVDRTEALKTFYRRIEGDLKDLGPHHVFQTVVAPILRKAKDEGYTKFLQKKALRDALSTLPNEYDASMEQTYNLTEDEFNVLKETIKNNGAIPLSKDSMNTWKKGISKEAKNSKVWSKILLLSNQVVRPNQVRQKKKDETLSNSDLIKQVLERKRQDISDDDDDDDDDDGDWEED